MVINEKENDNKTAIKFIFVKYKSSENIIFLIPRNETAPKIGIDNK